MLKVAPNEKDMHKRVREIPCIVDLDERFRILVRKYPLRFPAFVASLPMNDPAGLLKEARRAVRDLGAVGVQVFTNVLGRPLTAPEMMPLFEVDAGWARLLQRTRAEPVEYGP